MVVRQEVALPVPDGTSFVWRSLFGDSATDVTKPI